MSDASAERSAAGCTIKLDIESVEKNLKSNVVLMQNMIANGYEDKRTLQRRIEKLQAWLAAPNLLKADKDAEYAHVMEINMSEIKEPILCCPNDPDDANFGTIGQDHRNRRSRSPEYAWRARRVWLLRFFLPTNCRAAQMSIAQPVCGAERPHLRGFQLVRFRGDETTDSKIHLQRSQYWAFRNCEGVEI